LNILRPIGNGGGFFFTESLFLFPFKLCITDWKIFTKVILFEKCYGRLKICAKISFLKLLDG
jgi:hypothetical protein